MKGRSIGMAVALAVAGAAAAAVLPAREPIPQPPAAIASVQAAPTPRYHTAAHTVAEGDTAGSILHAMDPAADELLADAGSALDRLSIGDRIFLDYRADDPHPWRLRLDRDDPELVELEWDGTRYVASKRPVPYTIEASTRSLTVTSSLWEAAMDAGLHPAQIIDLAHIFEYDLDFNTELVKGATIQTVGETLTDDAGTQRFGDIRAAVLTNGGKSWTAIRYQMKDGSVGWFAPDGTGRRRPFLRSPLEFSHVTSSFTLSRYHPILKINRPHLGVDFGAPTGTPVRAVADGVVTMAGPNGGHGNYIQLDHEKPYSTSYSHLSAILVKRGAKVHQGEIIGRVGMTGLATGPHLHYQFFINGKYVNPMTVELPMTGSLPDAERDSFFAVRDSVMPLLAAAAAGGVGGAGTAPGAVAGSSGAPGDAADARSDAAADAPDADADDVARTAGAGTGASPTPAPGAKP